MAADKGSPLPKFGEWDVNDPASAEGFTVIFNKARDEKKAGANPQGQDVPVKSEQQQTRQGFNAIKTDNSGNAVGETPTVVYIKIEKGNKYDTTVQRPESQGERGPTKFFFV